MNCLYCGKPIPEPFRPTRKYCNVSHRVGAYKKRRLENPVSGHVKTIEAENEKIYKKALLSILLNKEEYQQINISDVTIDGFYNAPELLRAVKLLKEDKFLEYE